MLKIPNHIAIIMDGNGRWAKKRMLPRNAGHKQGVIALTKILKECLQLGIKCLTVYAFSTENFSRDKEEIDGLFGLIDEYFDKNCNEFVKNDTKVVVLGEKTLLSESLQQKIAYVENLTKDCKTMTFCPALAYGGRTEILSACNKLIESKEPATKENFEKYLYTAGISDPDLVIRTSGEQRISNFLLWQCAYSEFYFCKTLWPNFSPKHLQKAIEEFNKRERRFGKC